MNKLCVGCNTSYNLSAQDVGRRFTCFKCNTPLLVQPDGLHRADAGPPAPVRAVASSTEPAAAEVELLAPPGAAEPVLVYAAPRSRSRLPARILEAARRVADGPTWLFAMGTFFVIVFLFFPIINKAKVKRARAALEAGDQLEKAEEGWARKKKRLQEEVSQLEVEAASSEYGYTWGMMIGFLLLAAAALGYLNPAQPLIRRVVGAIVLVAEILLIFSKYIASGGLLRALLG